MITNETNDGATTAFQSTVVSDISSLKASIDSLKEDIQALKGKLNKEPTAVDDCDTCLIYMRLKHPTTEILNEGLLESKLSTTILGYDIIRITPTPAFRIKITKVHLHNALTHARANDCVADIWGGTLQPFCYKPTRLSTTINTASTTTQQSLRVTSWNCRGLATGTTYLDHLIREGSDVIVLSEHWLWPYELHKLEELNPNYRGLGKADSRLTEASDGYARGCGGVG